MIEFTAVSKSFRRVKVLEGLDLSVARGDRIALLGSNGAGKTTLIRCLLGQYKHGGRIEVLGKDPRRQRREVLQLVGFVPQLPPNLKMRVDDLLDFAAGASRADTASMEDVAGELGLSVDEIRKRPFDRLSGGQKQKLLIGIALGRSCDILIMDEPAANLDPEARQVFFQLLAERQETGSMIISSHRLDEVASLVNRVVELDLGRVVLDDHVADHLGMGSLLDCSVSLAEASPSFGKAASEWGLAEHEEGSRYEGVVAGPDRLRFLGMLSRHAGLLTGIELKAREGKERTDA